MSRHLERGCWAPENWERLDSLIQNHAFQGRYACFDFDNTTSIHAVDHELFTYQVHKLRFAIAPGQMCTVLSAGLDDLNRQLGLNLEGNPVGCGDYLCGDYDWLCQNQAIGAEEALLPSIWQAPTYQDFAVKLYWMRRMLDKVFPMNVSYPWCLYLLAGFTPDEVYQLGREAITYAMQTGRYGTVTVYSPEERRGNSGRICTTEERGLTFPQEMRDLYHTLQANGITPYLVSASPVELVRAGSEIAGLGVPPEQIYAMRMRLDAEGRYCRAYDYDWGGRGCYDQTFGPGKSRVIARFIAPRHDGRGPLLVCGDEENDIDMMTDWMACGDTELGLIPNHLRESCRHPRLYRALQEAVEQPEGRFLLQGVDMRTGKFYPAQSTIRENQGVPELFGVG